MKHRGGRSLRPAQLLWLLIPAVVLVSLFVMRPGSMKASPPASTLNVRLSLTGYIMAKSADQWQVNTASVAVDDQTRIDESQYPADLYAFVGVTASHRDGQAKPHADVITVLRPASAEGPLVQLSGPLKYLTGEEWLVAGYTVYVSPQVFPEAPPLGSLVSIIAQDRHTLLNAIRVEVVADNPDAIPVEFEGRITGIDSDQQTWLIDGELTVGYGNATVNGTPRADDVIEIRARLAPDGKLQATLAQVKGQQAAQVAMGVLITGINGQSDGAQTWTGQSFQAGALADPAPVRLQIDRNTWVDRRHAQPGNGQWAEIDAKLQADGTYHAEIVRLSQPAKVHLSGALRTLNTLRAPSTSSGAGWWLQVDGQTVWLPATAAGAAALKNGGQATLNGAATVDGWRLGNGVIWAERLVQ
jgi:hypothetical protein